MRTKEEPEGPAKKDGTMLSRATQNLVTNIRFQVFKVVLYPLEATSS